MIGSPSTLAAALKQHLHSGKLAVFSRRLHTVSQRTPKAEGLHPKRPDGQRRKLPGLVRAASLGSMATKQRRIPIPPFLAILSRCAREGCVSTLKWCKAGSTGTKDWPLVDATMSNHKIYIDIDIGIDRYRSLCIFSFIYLYIYMFIYIYLFIYIYTHIKVRIIWVPDELISNRK